jgi:hypothetical protein|tara:strand:+ start:3054 stop:3485 length:432 start_codon:yes stop_codon:yes gene_type:complete
VWEFADHWLHHDQERLPGGNTLLLQWRYMSRELSDRVKGGYVSENDAPEMLGDVIIEVTPDGWIAREWKAREHLDPERDAICPIDHRKEWTHANSIAVTPGGQWIVSFRHLDLMSRIRFWRYLLGDEHFDADYWLTRVENEPA